MASFIVGMLPLRPIYNWYVIIVARFKVAKYQRDPFPRWYANITARFMVCKLLLWPILWLESYHRVTFYGR